jgi:adenylosuccinate lyase
MAAIWADERRYAIWLDIELAATHVLEEQGLVPKGTAHHIRNHSSIRPHRINEIEETTKHDVIAFLTSIAETAGEPARFLHLGMTSSDVLDTCLSIQLRDAAVLLQQGLDTLLEALKKQALAHKHTPTIGRSHGIHAEPTSFGLKLAGFYAEFSRNKKRLAFAKEDVSTCAISGAVGTFAHLHPSIEEAVAIALDLTPEPVSTQVIPRDRHAAFFSVLGVIASSLERLAVEIRHLQRTEVREVEEFFSKGQKGSSAMPHKRNPVLSENITGIARLVRGAVIPMLENVALWHERDISHSSVERVLAPDATIALDFALHRMAGVIDTMLVYPNMMQQNLNATKGLVYSQRVLLELAKNGCSREEAYGLVQHHAMRTWHGEGDFLSLLLEDDTITKYCPQDTLKALFDVDWYLKHVDTIFHRVFGALPKTC